MLDNMFIPLSDYQTADGDRLDKVGVSSPYEVDPNEAFNVVMTELIGEDSK